MGGRGNAGATREGAGSLSKEDNDILKDSDTWYAWSEDPSTYQALADPERRNAKIDELLEDGYDEEEIRDLERMALAIKNGAESTLVKGVSTLYRGERFKSLEEAQRKYKIGAAIVTPQLTSYSIDKSVAESYAKMYGDKVAVVIMNKSTEGDFAGYRTHHAGYSKGQSPEVIVPKGLMSRVVGVNYDRDTNTLYVTMENRRKINR